MSRFSSDNFEKFPEKNWRSISKIVEQYFQFWPDGEDRMWLKRLWPTIEGHVFSDFSEEADLWTQNNLFILHLLYAESLSRLGVDHHHNKYLTREWIIVRFGSIDLFDEHFFKVGNDVLYFDDEIEHDVVLLPLLRSVVLGSGLLFKERELSSYLERVRDMQFDYVFYNEPELHRFWAGGFFSYGDLSCLVEF